VLCSLCEALDEVQRLRRLCAKGVEGGREEDRLRFGAERQIFFVFVADSLCKQGRQRNTRRDARRGDRVRNNDIGVKHNVRNVRKTRVGALVGAEGSEGHRLSGSRDTAATRGLAEDAHDVVVPTGDTTAAEEHAAEDVRGDGGIECLAA